MIDIQQDATGDLIMINGDIKYGESTRQHQYDILMAQKGEYRLNPTGTVGAIDFIEDENPDDFLQEIRIQFQKDKMKINKIEYVGEGKLNIQANY